MTDASYPGSQRFDSALSMFAQIDFVARQVLAGVATATLVMVVKVENGGGVEPVGKVDIKPLVMQIDADGVGLSHGVIHNVPYARLQGGTDAIILDPKVGDMGIALFASRDISSVKETKREGLPGSRRTHDYADALYIGGVLNGAPERYIRFHDDGIEIKAATVTITGDLTVTGTATATVDVVGGGKSLKGHTHTGVTTGGGSSGPPS